MPAPDNDPAPRDFYTGIVADLYGPLRAVPTDPEPYRRFVERGAGPALELGCGDGEPLLDLIAAGLDVEGLDSSADMLARCRDAASERGLDVTLHHAPMEAVDLGRRYRSIYLAGATFNLLPDDDHAARALAAIARHLEPGGRCLIPLFIPEPTPASHIGALREQADAEGTVRRVGVIAESRDEDARTQTSVLRYERNDEAVERPWVMHWHTIEGFASLAEDAGLHVRAVRQPDGTEPDQHATEFVFILGARPSAP